MSSTLLCENPSVSLVVIAYNSSEYIIETLESIRKQTYENIETIPFTLERGTGLLSFRYSGKARYRYWVSVEIDDVEYAKIMSTTTDTAAEVLCGGVFRKEVALAPGDHVLKLIYHKDYTGAEAYWYRLDTFRFFE